MRHLFESSVVERVDGALTWSPIPRRATTWRLLHSVYQKRRYDVDRYDVPTDPLAVFWVDPDDIETMTGREWKPWNGRQSLLGSVNGGDWDRTPISNPPAYYDTYPRTYDDWFFHESVREHFNGTSWPETQLYDVWRDQGRNHSEVMAKLSRITELYDSIRTEGYRAQQHLYLAGEGEPSVLGAICNEILVDIGRDGELLFVDGRHRLSVAKVLDIERVSVVALVRHKSWMERRERHYHETGRILTPPDFLSRCCP